MKTLLEQSKYLVLIGVVASLVACVAAFGWGVVKTINVIGSLINTAGKYPNAAVSLIELMDAFLIAVALYIFAVGVYELFIGDLNLPQWLVIHDLQALKTKLVNVVILVMAIAFLQRFYEGRDPVDTLLSGVAVAVVSGVLIAFNRYGDGH